MALERATFPGSSSIASASYDPETSILTAYFTSGDEYTYTGVPEEVWRGLLAAPSAGGYFYSRIRSSYPYEQS